ncbi:hypothetical protein [Weissella viridescens]|uniref:hypothetical protein n=1 Tax=Weissella viridescens TaxID=1629 RepID=UPI003AF2BB5B
MNWQEFRQEQITTFYHLIMVNLIDQYQMSEDQAKAIVDLVEQTAIDTKIFPYI